MCRRSITVPRLSALSLLLILPPINFAAGDQRVEQLLEEVTTATEKAKTITADFSYVTVKPTLEGEATTKIQGTIKLMKPNYAYIDYNPESRYSRWLVSDGKQFWTFNRSTFSYSKIPVDPDGKNINVWRLVTIGGFFDIEHWMKRGIYVGDMNALHYLSKETIKDVEYDVLEHKMTGTIQGKACPFHQKVFISPEKLVTRFTLDFTLDGKPGSELAELTNIKLGVPMEPSEFEFLPPENSFLQESPTR